MEPTSNHTASVPTAQDLVAISFQIHWLTVSFRGDLETLKRDTSVMLGTYEDTDRGGLGYKFSRRFLQGAVWYEDPDYGHATLVMSGSSCELVPQGTLVVLMRMAVECGGHVTRLDLAFDHMPFTPREFWVAFKSGEGVTCRAVRDKCHFDETIGAKDETAYIGKRASERMLRVYDRRGYTRCELEVKGDQARMLCSLILASEDVKQTARSFLHGFLDMADSLWRYFRDAPLVEAPMKLLKQVSRERLMSWLTHQVAAALSALLTCDELDHDVLGEILAAGTTKRSYRRYVACLNTA